MYKFEYTGFGYPSPTEICKRAKASGFTHYYWATESVMFSGFYNGDTVVVYDSTDNMPAPIKEDAERYGEVIK